MSIGRKDDREKVQLDLLPVLPLLGTAPPDVGSSLLVAQGLTGKARGNPGIRETIAFLETKSLSNDDLGLGTLQLTPHFE